MEAKEIISRVNGFLHETADALARWLESVLPRVSESWWEDCVMASLSYSQRELATSRGFHALKDFDLAALLRIANKSWYDMRTVMYLSTQERECVRDMIGVRNNWAHCSIDLPGKDTIVGDLNTIARFSQQLNMEHAFTCSVLEFAESIENNTMPSPANGEAEESPAPVAEQVAEKKSVDAIDRGQIVRIIGEATKTGVVLNIEEIGNTQKYTVFVDNGIRTFYASQITPIEEKPKYTPVDAQTFCSMMAAYQINHPSSQNLYSLNSARIDFVPYQFRPALKLIHADEPRILIADSVGVGKTIETGLIIKELEARSTLNRILIICPRPLVAERKWEFEMKRFDEEFIPLDGPALRHAISDTDRDGEWPARYNKCIMPYSILDSRAYEGDDSKHVHSFGLSELDPAPHFDLVVVDEAHHIRNGSMDKERAFAYKSVKFFCDHSDAVVLLTATPLQTSDHDLYTLLNLLRPDVVIDEQTFATIAKPNQYISECARIIRRCDENWASDAKTALLDVKKTQWGENVIAENPLFNSVLERLSATDISREDRVQILSDVESLHSFNGMLNRTRRKDIQDFCIRRPYTIETQFTAKQRELHDELLHFERATLSLLHNPRNVPFMMSMMKRQAASCIFGLAPYMRCIVERRIDQLNEEPEIAQYNIDLTGDYGDDIASLAKKVLKLAEHLPGDDPKFDRLMDIIKSKHQQENNKIMLFSTFRHTLAYLYRRLAEKGLRVGQVDGSVKDEDRYELKRRFELPKESSEALDILLFTEVGSEGLDYQFCDMMVNYDLPWNPMRVEQRIGRIDRRGQKSESVSIYNIITRGTVDADVYDRCLLRIGVFERSIGDCDEILGEIATQIEETAVNPALTDDERRRKLEQIADNEVRKIQEINRLEDEEKELFGFDLSEFTTSQEIRRAESPWLNASTLERLVNEYLKARAERGALLQGNGAMKNLRLPASARQVLKDDFRNLRLTRNAASRRWEEYLSLNKPNHEITFDPNAAAENVSAFFITPVHPLAKQAAQYYSFNDPVCMSIAIHSDVLPTGKHPFAVYAWKYTGNSGRSQIVVVSDDERISTELQDSLPHAVSLEDRQQYEWPELEAKQIMLWEESRASYRRDLETSTAYKLESLRNNHTNHIRSLQQKLRDSTDESICRMYKSEIENATEAYESKCLQIRSDAENADIHTQLLASGLVSIYGEGA